MKLTRPPLLAGAGAALLAAASFGVTAPLIAVVGKGLGPLTTAALLYAGASASSLPSLARRRASAALRPAHWWRLLAMALLGGAVAPTLLAWGLQRIGAFAGSLLLNLEAAFTVLLAWLAYRESIGQRVVAALALMTLGGTTLAFGAGGDARFTGLGALAVAGATLAWAIDNTLSRELSQQNPVVVVATKGALGAALTASLAYALGESLPHASVAVILLACGASGYGLSLRLYLRAQGLIGAARTGSIFAVAPFIGAALGFALGDRAQTVPTALAALFFGLGLWLHLTEQRRHDAHEHVHESKLHHEHRHS
jgi:drug/metabolite transporter (DMT)-like permease